MGYFSEKNVISVQQISFKEPPGSLNKGSTVYIYEYKFENKLDINTYVNLMCL